MVKARGTEFWLLTGAMLAAVGAESVHAQSRPGTVEESRIRLVRTELEEAVDRYTGHRVIRPKERKTLDGGGGLVGADVSLQPVYLRPRSGASGFFFQLVYRGLGWRLLDGRLELLVDGTDRMEAVGNPSTNREVIACGSILGCVVTEVLLVPIERSLLARLSFAHSVELRASGDRAALDGWFKSEHFAQVRTMLDQVAETDQVAPEGLDGGEGIGGPINRGEPAPPVTMQEPDSSLRWVGWFAARLFFPRSCGLVSFIPLAQRRYFQRPEQARTDGYRAAEIVGC